MCNVTIFHRCWIKPDRESSVMCYVTIFDLTAGLSLNPERSVMCYVTIFDHCWIKPNQKREIWSHYTSVTSLCQAESSSDQIWLCNHI